MCKKWEKNKALRQAFLPPSHLPQGDQILKTELEIPQLAKSFAGKTLRWCSDLSSSDPSTAASKP